MAAACCVLVLEACCFAALSEMLHLLHSLPKHYGVKLPGHAVCCGLSAASSWAAQKLMWQYSYSTTAEYCSHPQPQRLGTSGCYKIAV